MASNTEKFGGIIDLYRKHGWELRRVCLTSNTAAAVGNDAEALFGPIIPTDGAIDAAWFTRSSKPGTESWELRRLFDPPFALVEVFDAALPDSDREARLSEMFEGMVAATTRSR